MMIDNVEVSSIVIYVCFSHDIFMKNNLNIFSLYILKISCIIKIIVIIYFILKNINAFVSIIVVSDM